MDGVVLAVLVRSGAAWKLQHDIDKIKQLQVMSEMKPERTDVYLPVRGIYDQEDAVTLLEKAGFASNISCFQMQEARFDVLAPFLSATKNQRVIYMDNNRKIVLPIVNHKQDDIESTIDDFVNSYNGETVVVDFCKKLF